MSRHPPLTGTGRSHAGDLRGVARLAIEATTGIADLVEAMNLQIASGPGVLGRPLAAPARFFARLVFGNVRGITRAVGGSIDFALSHGTPLLGQSSPGQAREAVLAALNGVVGDHLQATGNPLAIEMRLRHGGERVELKREALRAMFPAAGAKVLVLVHGSSTSDLGWTRNGHDHGAALARDLGYTPLYLHYNSGLHISANGSAFSGLLETLLEEWPVPLEELSLLCHSMGGLVARSACDSALRSGSRWLSKLRNLVFLGTPHHGAPFERAGALVDAVLELSAYSAPFARLGKIRSAGITDMRHGNPLPLPEGVRCFAAAATKANIEAGKSASDGLVPVDSALGRHPTPELTLAFPPGHHFVGVGMNHLDLLSRPEMYETLRGWLAPPRG